MGVQNKYIISTHNKLSLIVTLITDIFITNYFIKMNVQNNF